MPTVDDYRDVPLLEARPPDVARYFVRVKPDVLDRFATEFVRTVHLAWARSGGTTAPPPGAEASPAVFARRSP